MATKSPEIQVWLAECLSQEERDQIAERSAKIEGCRVVFIGQNDEGKFVVIMANTGKAITTPAVDFYGYKQYPEGPNIDMLVGFSINVQTSLTST